MLRKVINSILFLPIALSLNSINVLSSETKEYIDNVLEEKSGKTFIKFQDVEKIIIDTLNVLRAEYDYGFTTGGIGPTHDDITTEYHRLKEISPIFTSKISQSARKNEGYEYLNIPFYLNGFRPVVPYEKAQEDFRYYYLTNNVNK